MHKDNTSQLSDITNWLAEHIVSGSSGDLTPITTHAEALQVLDLLAASHFHAAAQLIRLREGGFDVLPIGERKHNSWVIQAVDTANAMTAARLRLHETIEADDLET